MARASRKRKREGERERGRERKRERNLKANFTPLHRIYIDSISMLDCCNMQIKPNLSDTCFPSSTLAVSMDATNRTS